MDGGHEVNRECLRIECWGKPSVSRRDRLDAFYLQQLKIPVTGRLEWTPIETYRDWRNVRLGGIIGASRVAMIAPQLSAKGQKPISLTAAILAHKFADQEHGSRK